MKQIRRILNHKVSDIIHLYDIPQLLDGDMRQKARTRAEKHAGKMTAKRAARQTSQKKPKENHKRLHKKSRPSAAGPYPGARTQTDANILSIVNLTCRADVSNTENQPFRFIQRYFAEFRMLFIGGIQTLICSRVTCWFFYKK